MKLIIAGGRDYYLTDADYAKLDEIHWDALVTEVVYGCATGADECGKKWADSKGIKTKPFRPDWNDIKHPRAVIRKRKDGSLYNAAAGPIRNEAMAEYAEAVALFRGGDGTASMYREAVKRGLRIYDYRT